MWEYRILKSEDDSPYDMFVVPSTEDIEQYLDKLGSQGWEIVNFNFDINNQFGGLAKRRVNNVVHT